jgi:integral membrane protein (TIGR01906 family)
MLTYRRVSNWLVTLLTPVLLVLLAVRIMLTPLFIQVEYHLPGFPEDRYGITIDERLYWADISRVYLISSLEDQFLSELRFPAGQQAAGDCTDFSPPRDCAYFYNDRELQHMFDVKDVVQGAMWVLYASVGILFVLGFWARKSGWWSEYLESLSRGGWLTVGLIVAILVYLGLNFNSLFVTFHRIFFEGDTWLFRYSDSLIRLFPEKFWRDAFIWIGSMALAGGAALGYFLGRKSKNR